MDETPVDSPLVIDGEGAIDAAFIKDYMDSHQRVVRVARANAEAYLSETNLRGVTITDEHVDEEGFVTAVVNQSYSQFNSTRSCLSYLWKRAGIDRPPEMIRSMEKFMAGMERTTRNEKRGEYSESVSTNDPEDDEECDDISSLGNLDESGQCLPTKQKSPAIKFENDAEHEKLRQRWEVQGRDVLAIRGVTPTEAAVENSIRTAMAESDRRTFIMEFRRDLQYIPDDHIKRLWADSCYVLAIKHS